MHIKCPYCTGIIETRVSKSDRAILHILNGRKYPAPFGYIRMQLGVSEGYLWNRLVKLVRKGVVTRTRKGFYTIGGKYEPERAGNAYRRIV